MIPVKRPDLGPEAEAALKKRQESASALLPRDPRIQDRWAYFLRQDAETVAAVRATLDAMFGDVCCYCEKEIARDIEHYCPKSLYPQQMFLWSNLLRACKDCNFEKHNKDPLGTDGQRWLLDPTQDNPEDHFLWDLETGFPIYLDWKIGIPHRAEDTLQVCGVDHPTHAEVRRERGAWFKYLLIQISQEDPIRSDTRALAVDLLRRPQRRSVIRQIVQSPQFAPMVQALLRKIPELAPAIEQLQYRHPNE